MAGYKTDLPCTLNHMYSQTWIIKATFIEWSPSITNPLSPNIQNQILHTSVHTLPYRISWENLIKDQSIFPLFIILLILLTFSLNDVLIYSHVVRRKLMLITLGTQRVLKQTGHLSQGPKD